MTEIDPRNEHNWRSKAVGFEGHEVPIPTSHFEQGKVAGARMTNSVRVGAFVRRRPEEYRANNGQIDSSNGPNR